MANPKYDWKKIDRWLLMACFVKNRKEREDLIARLQVRWGMCRRTLDRRLQWLGGRWAPYRLTPKAIDDYEKRMLLAIEGEVVYMRLRARLLNQTDDMRVSLIARHQRSLTKEEVARLLHVDYGVVRDAIELGLLLPEMDGRVSANAVRDFCKKHHWFFKSNAWRPKAGRYGERSRTS